MKFWAVVLASVLLLAVAVIMLTNDATRTIRLPKAETSTKSTAA